MQLLSGLYLVASGSLGLSLTDPYDCNCYLWEYAAGEFVLFDSGSGRNMDLLLHRLHAVLGHLQQIRYICLTHHHADHMGGAAVLKGLTGAKVVASPHCGAIIASGDEYAIGVAQSRAKGGYPPDYRIESCPVDLLLSEGDALELGNHRLSIVETPGHCRGALSYRLTLEGKQALVSGDVIFPGGKIMLLNLPDCSIQDYSATISKLRQIDLDILLPGHAEAILSGAGSHIETAFHCFDKLAVPPCLT